MKRSSYVTLLVCVLMMGALAYAQMPQPFSADFSVTTKSQAGAVSGKLFVSMPNMRMNMSSRGMEMSMIMDGSKPTTYMIMHAQKMYMEFKPGQANPMARNLPQMESKFDPKNPCASSGHNDATCKDLGPDTFDGRACEKWLVTQKNGHTTTMWIDNKLHFPIRSETSDGTTSSFTNIKEGPQPAALFQVPDGYRKMDMPAIPVTGGERGPQ